MLKNKRVYLIPFLGFAILISVGTILLYLPVCNNKPIKMIDALFVSTSSVCVTGFSTVTISEQFNSLGQIVLAMLMQIGALGFMIFIALIFILKKKRIKLSDTMLLGNSINSNDYGKIKEKILQILKYTFFLEFLGAIIMAIRFIPSMGLKKGLWYGIFHSISAFCNAGLDLFDNTSLIYFRQDITINCIFIFLIITGGIGFFVIDDIAKKLKITKNHKLNFQSKLVLVSTTVVLFITTMLIYLFENNISLLDSLFASTTLRTAGFYTIPFQEFTLATKIICLFAMFIGGAPGSTSGGIRIVAFSIFIITTISVFRNKKEVVIFNRKIDDEMIKRALALGIATIFVILMGILLFVWLNNFGLLNIVFHTVSAVSAVGLTLYDCSLFNIAGKIITILLMYIGRVGPITVIELFIIERKENKNVSYVSGNVIL